jgi:hypothetical protein
LLCAGNIVVGPSEFLRGSALQCRKAAEKASDLYAPKLICLAEKLEQMAAEKDTRETVTSRRSEGSTPRAIRAKGPRQSVVG